MNHNIFKLSQYKSIHQGRRTGKGGVIVAFFHESLTFKIRHDIEGLRVEIINKKSKNFLLTLSIADQQEISMNLRHI